MVDEAVDKLAELVMASKAIDELVELVIADKAIDELVELKMANEAVDELVELVMAKKSIMIYNVIAADLLVVAVEFDKAVDFVDKASMLPCHNIIVICVNMLSSFSLTKCSSFFSKDKGYLGICVDVCNNKLLVAKCINQLECLESCWSKLCSLRIQNLRSE